MDDTSNQDIVLKYAQNKDLTSITPWIGAKLAAPKSPPEHQIGGTYVLLEPCARPNLLGAT